MKAPFKISFRGIVLEVDKQVLLQLPPNSPFTKNVQEQCKQDLAECLAGDTTDFQIYINRSASMFNHILDYIAHGELHFPHGICSAIVCKELEFWGYSLRDLGTCCFNRILKEQENMANLKVVTENWMDTEDRKEPQICCSMYKKSVKVNDIEDTSMNRLGEKHHARDTEDNYDRTIDKNEQRGLKKLLSHLVVNPFATLSGKVF